MKKIAWLLITVCLVGLIGVPVQAEETSEEVLFQGYVSEVIEGPNGEVVINFNNWLNDENGSMIAFFDGNGNIVHKIETSQNYTSIGSTDTGVYIFYNNSDYESATRINVLEKRMYSGELIWSKNIVDDNDNTGTIYRDSFAIAISGERIFLGGTYEDYSNNHYDNYDHGSSYEMRIFDLDGNLLQSVISKEEGNTYYHPMAIEGGVKYALARDNYSEDNDEIDEATFWYKLTDGGSLSVISEEEYDSLAITDSFWGGGVRRFFPDNGPSGKSTGIEQFNDYSYGIIISDHACILVTGSDYEGESIVLYYNNVNLGTDQVFNSNINNKLYGVLGLFSGELTEGELTLIRQVDFSYSNLSDLGGIEKLVNLESIDLSFNKIEDLSPLAKLENLKTVNVTGNSQLNAESIAELEGKGVTIVNETIVLNEEIDMLVNESNSVEEVQENIETYIEDEINQTIGGIVEKAVGGKELNGFDFSKINKEAERLKDESYMQLLEKDVELKQYLDIEAMVPVDMNNGIDLELSSISSLDALDCVRLSDMNVDIILNPGKLSDSGKLSVSKKEAEVESMILLDTLAEQEGIPKFYGNLLSQVNTGLITANEANESIINTYAALPSIRKVSSVKVDLDSKDAIKIGLPNLHNSSDAIMKITDDGYEVIGGRLNHESGKLEAFITESGEYFVMENNVSIDDIDTYDQEMQTVIQTLLSKNIMKDVDSSFDAKEMMDRDELTFAVMRLIGRLNPQAVPTFNDVNDTSPYYSYIGTSEEIGMINGFDDGTFRPKDDMMLNHMLKVMSAALTVEKGYRITPEMDKYLASIKNNSEIETWARDFVAFAMREGFVSLDSDMNYFGSSTITREEAARLLYELYLRL